MTRWPALAWLAVLLGCAPRVAPLTGAPAPADIPSTALPAGSRRVLFQWTLEDRDFTARGEGAARIAAPDSARLDFFLAGGYASGAAVLLGDRLELPPGADELVRRLIPPAPLLWATLGRVALPVTQDTIVRVDGDSLRADIGSPAAWRLTFIRDTLRRVERIHDGRIVEWVTRDLGSRVRYRHEPSRRQLDLHITRIDDVPVGFRPDIWKLP